MSGVSGHALRGRLPTETAKGVCAAPDYKAMYFELFRASVQAVELLQSAQARAEEQLLADDPPPIRLDETEKEDT